MRLSVLRSYDLLDQPDVATYDAAARIAAHLAGTSIGEINIIDDTRQQQVAAFGKERTTARKQDALCPRVVATGRALYTPDASRDPAFSGTPFVDGRLGSIRRYAAVPLRTEDGFVLGTVCVWDEEPGVITPAQMSLLEDVAGQVTALFEARRMARWFAHDAMHDPLTGLANRSLLMERLERAFARRGADRRPLMLVALDLEAFKAVNDAYGHAVGDAVLREVAERLRRAMRPEDTVARLGGDEFVILLEHPGVSQQGVVQRVRGCFAESCLLPATGRRDPVELRLAASVGAAAALGDGDAAGLLAAADEAMYADKRQRGALPKSRRPHQPAADGAPRS